MQARKSTVTPAERSDAETFYTRAEAAAYIGRSYDCLAAWAMRGEGPRYVKIGGRTAYSLRDLRAFMDVRLAA